MGNTAQCRKMHLKVGELTHWCAWTTKLQTFVFQSNIGLSGQSKYVNRRENSKESNAASAIAARCCGPQLRSLQDTSRHFALLRANQTIQTRGFPLFKRPTISATGSDVLEALSASSRKNWASWDNGDGNGERFSCDGASPALKRCLQLVAQVLCFICYRIWAQRFARRQSFPESPRLWEIGQRKQEIFYKVGETIVGIAPKIEMQFETVSYCRGYKLHFPWSKSTLVFCIRLLMLLAFR